MHKFVYLYIFLVFFLLNPYILNYIHLGFVIPPNKISFISFYPLVFFPVFLEKTTENKILSVQFLLGICLTLFAFVYFSFTFFWLGTVFICLSFLTFYNFKFHILGYVVFLLAPPFVEKYSILIGFELRILLSKISGFILQIFDSNTNVMGNTIVFQNVPYSIDPSCEGLKFFTGVILLFICFSFTYLKKEITARKLLITLLIGLFAILLWLWANLVRILILICFSIPETSTIHFLIGIVIFLTVVGIPFTLIWFYFIEKEYLTPHSFLDKNGFNLSYPQKLILFLPILFSVLILIRFKDFTYPVFDWEKKYGTFYLEENENNYESQFYRNKTATMILKRNLPILGLGHHPKICFEAVGYKFNEEEEIKFSNTESIRRAKIKLNENEYFLSWWYIEDNSNYSPRKRTASEWKWRKDFIQNQKNIIQVNLITQTIKEAEHHYKELAKDRL